MSRVPEGRAVSVAFLVATCVLLLGVACATGPSNDEVVAVWKGYYGGRFEYNLLLNMQVLKRGKPRKVGGEQLFPFTVETRYISPSLNYGGYYNDTEHHEVVELLLHKDNFAEWAVYDLRGVSSEVVGEFRRPASTEMADYYRDRLGGRGAVQAAGQESTSASGASADASVVVPQAAEVCESRLQKVESKLAHVDCSPAAKAEVTALVARARVLLAEAKAAPPSQSAVALEKLSAAKAAAVEANKQIRALDVGGR